MAKYDMNKVMAAGRIGRDLELRHTQAGKAVTSFSIALNCGEKDGEKKTTWVDVTAFGGTAEVITKYFAKGDQIILEGHLNQEKWVDKASGENRSKLAVVVDHVHFFDGKARSNGEGAPAPAAATGDEAY